MNVKNPHPCTKFGLEEFQMSRKEKTFSPALGKIDQ